MALAAMGQALVDVVRSALYFCRRILIQLVILYFLQIMFCSPSPLVEPNEIFRLETLLVLPS